MLKNNLRGSNHVLGKSTNLRGSHILGKQANNSKPIYYQGRSQLANSVYGNDICHSPLCLILLSKVDYDNIRIWTKY